VPPPTQPDFTLTVQPATVTVAPGSSAPVTVGVTGSNGFASQVGVTVTGMPAGLTVSPAQFTLSSGGQQAVTIAATTAVTGSANLTVTGTSGSLNHTRQIAVEFANPQTPVYPSLRTRYARTDAFWDVAYFVQQLVLYEPVTKRFFFSNTWLNRIDVFDATSQLKIGEIGIPEPWVGDETPDHQAIYMGTQIGDIYEIDPVALKVMKRIPALQIGPSGYAAYEVRVMADGRLLLLGGQGGIPSVDGFANLAVWNPSDNSIEIFASSYGMGESGAFNVSQPAICDFLENIGELALTADRTKIILESTASDDTLCVFDPSTRDQRIVQAPFSSVVFSPILVPADGNEIIAANGTTVTVYDSSGLYQTDQFQVSPGSGGYRFLLSFDGSTLYAEDNLYGTTLAYDWKTHQQKGWITNFAVDDPIPFVTPMAVDPTGLIVGPVGDGVGFLDGAAILSSQPQFFSYVFSNVLQPATGPVQGGTSALIRVPIAKNLGKVYFGQQVATVASSGTSGVTATTPPGSPGPVDVAVSTTDGGLLMVPEGFSYGPSIVETIPTTSTAEGGGTGIVYGYGFGPTEEGAEASGLQVSVGGQSATITNYSGQPPPLAYSAYPIQFVEFTLPPRNAGSTADITVTSPSGATTAKEAVQYLPAVQQFSLPGAVLVQGVYDPRRDLYYFTDRTKIQVFSKTQGIWLAPINIPHAGRLWGIALSPDGSKLAVADAGNDVVDVLNPDSPSAVSVFSLPGTGFDATAIPSGVAITDSGTVYYASFSVSIYGVVGLHKLDTSTGAVSDYTDFMVSALGADAAMRLLLTSDNARLFVTVAGYVTALDTATDTTITNPVSPEGDYEMTLSSNQTWMSAAEYLMDTNLNAESAVALTQREVWNQTGVYGEKISPDGNLLFIPLINGIYVVDGKRGSLLKSIALPFTLSANYDALVSDGKDNILVAITGQNGDGVAIIDLTSLPEPLPLPYSSVATDNLKRLPQGSPATVMQRSHLQSAKVAGRSPAQHPQRIPHLMNRLILTPRVH
jgi:WD40 repeat protein